MGLSYYYGQDGMAVQDGFINLFDLTPRDIRYSDLLEKYLFDFVGFVFRKEKILVVFPKNYYSESEVISLNSTHQGRHKDIKLLFNVIQKYREKERSAATAKSYLGSQEGYESDYPFRPFFEVYDYYQKYGLYKEKNEKIVAGTKGMISWKNTISKSNKIINEGNLVFYPFYVKRKDYNNAFLTECMAFIIDYTVEQFQDFLTLRKTGYRLDFDFLNNIDYVIQQLKTGFSSVFKDVNKKLINSMIVFFEQYRGKSKGGNLHVKVRYFDMIWQKMISSFINRHFREIDPISGAAVFDMTRTHSTVFFTDTSFNDIDDSAHHFSIDIDHMAYDSGILFVFDSKYYVKIKELNYKQLAYNELLRYHFPDLRELHNILFLPGSERSEMHFCFGADYLGPRTIGTKIVEQYLNPQTVMEDYISC